MMLNQLFTTDFFECDKNTFMLNLENRYDRIKL